MKKQIRIEINLLLVLALVGPVMMLSCSEQDQLLTTIPPNEIWEGQGLGHIHVDSDSIFPFFDWHGIASWYDPWDTADGGDSSYMSGYWEDNLGHAGTFTGLRVNLGRDAGQCEGTWKSNPPLNLQGTWVGVWPFLPHPGDSADVEDGYWYVSGLQGQGSYTGRGGHNWPDEE